MIRLVGNAEEGAIRIYGLIAAAFGAKDDAVVGRLPGHSGLVIAFLRRCRKVQDRLDAFAKLALTNVGVDQAKPQK